MEGTSFQLGKHLKGGPYFPEGGGSGVFWGKHLVGWMEELKRLSARLCRAGPGWGSTCGTRRLRDGRLLGGGGAYKGEISNGLTVR